MTTFYREGSRKFEPLTPVRLGDAKKELDKKIKQHTQSDGIQELGVVFESNPIDQAAMDCVDGLCSLDAWKAEHKLTF